MFKILTNSYTKMEEKKFMYRYIGKYTNCEWLISIFIERLATTLLSRKNNQTIDTPLVDLHTFHNVAKL